MKAPTRAHTMESISLQDAERSRTVYGEHCLEGVVVIDHVGNGPRLPRWSRRLAQPELAFQLTGLQFL
jgi:hypothetical protein